MIIFKHEIQAKAGAIFEAPAHAYAFIIICFFYCFINILNYILFKSVCQKCGLDTHDSDGDAIWLCLLCSEHREVC